MKTLPMPKTGIEADRMAAAIEERLGYVMIAIKPECKGEYQRGDEITNLWGCETAQTYQAFELGTRSEWFRHGDLIGELIGRPCPQEWKDSIAPKTVFWKLRRVVLTTAAKSG